jgi:hypothetical protein
MKHQKNKIFSLIGEKRRRGDLTLAIVALILMQCNAHAVTKGEKGKGESGFNIFFLCKEFLIERILQQYLSEIIIF